MYKEKEDTLARDITTKVKEKTQRQLAKEEKERQKEMTKKIRQDNKILRENAEWERKY